MNIKQLFDAILCPPGGYEYGPKSITYSCATMRAGIFRLLPLPDYYRHVLESSPIGRIEVSL